MHESKTHPRNPVSFNEILFATDLEHVSSVLLNLFCSAALAKYPYT